MWVQLHFVVAVLNNTHLLSYSSGSQKSKMGLPRLKIKVWAGLCSLGGSRGESISLPLPASVYCNSNLLKIGNKGLHKYFPMFVIPSESDTGC